MNSGDTSSGGARELQSFESFVALLRDKLTNRNHPLVIAIDGRSGAGKSTLTAAVSRELCTEGIIAQVTVIEGDDFYAGGSAETWISRTAAENASRVIDWRRQRNALEQILRDGVTEWYPFDWDAETWDSDVGPLKHSKVSARTSALIILEGVYSCRPELQDLLDLKVLLVAPEDVRVRQLIEREGDSDQDGWVARWAASEDHYFRHIMPRQRFDLIVQNCRSLPD